MELKVNEVNVPDHITFNYEELKNELTEKVAKYETLVYTDEQIKDAKADKANLNKLKKALNDERIRREKEYMKPFNEFKSQINEIIAIIDKPVRLIDKQVKEYDEKQKEEKRNEIEKLWDSLDHPEELKLDMIFNDSFLNKSFRMSQVEDVLNGWIERFKREMQTLSELPEFSFEAREVYKSTFDINKALSEGKRLSEIQKRKAEAEKQKQLDVERQRQVELEKREEKKRESEEPEIEHTEDHNEEERMWIAFKANMTVEDAKELKAFFDSRNIEFMPA